MNQIRFIYFLKKIPISRPDEYRRYMIGKVESVIKRMRWKAHFFLEGETNSRSNIQHFVFKSTKTPPQIHELKPFEEDMFQMIENLEFRRVNDPFVNTLHEDKKKIRSSQNVLVFADKTRNLYEMDKSKYNQFLTENITKS